MNEEIKELAEIIKANGCYGNEYDQTKCDKHNGECPLCIADALYNQGYRKSHIKLIKMLKKTLVGKVNTTIYPNDKLYDFKLGQIKAYKNILKWIDEYEKL